VSIVCFFGISPLRDLRVRCFWFLGRARSWRRRNASSVIPSTCRICRRKVHFLYLSGHFSVFETSSYSFDDVQGWWVLLFGGRALHKFPRSPPTLSLRMASPPPTLSPNGRVHPPCSYDSSQLHSWTDAPLWSLALSEPFSLLWSSKTSFFSLSCPVFSPQHALPWWRRFLFLLPPGPSHASGVAQNLACFLARLTLLPLEPLSVFPYSLRWFCNTFELYP